MIETMFFNTMYFVLPFMVYFVYAVCSKVRLEKEKLVFLDLTFLSSLYLCIRFGKFDLSLIILLNLILYISLRKKRNIASAVVGVIISVFLASIYKNISAMIFIMYLLIILTSLLKYDTKKVIFIIKFIFIILIFNKFDKNILYLLSYPFILYVYFIIADLVFDKLLKVINMSMTLDDIKKEKRHYESLFKITHEIKNPLAVCKGYLEMFDLKDEKKAKKYINIIDEEIDRTLILLKDFKDVANINLDTNIVDVPLLLEDIKDEVSLSFNKNIKFIYSDNDDEIYINGDYNRLKQVIINLIKNSKEAIKNKGTVKLDLKKSGKKCVISIIDDGIGMDLDTKNKIGTPFFTTKENGTGLGVKLSKEIIEKHNGELLYESKLNKGTTAKIMLPTIKIKE